MFKVIGPVTWLAVTVLLLGLGAPLAVAAVMAVVPALVAGVAFRNRGSSPKVSVTRGRAPLTITDQPDGWAVIDACPPPLPTAVTAIPILVGAMTGFGVIAMGGPYRSLAGMLVQGAVTWGVVGGLLLVWVRAMNNAKRHLQPGPFAVRHEAVRSPEGQEVPAGRIYALTLRNGVDGDLSVMVNNSTIGRMSSLGAARHAARLAAIAYRLDLDHDGRSTTLAGGLTETQARAVATEVLSRLRLLTQG